MRPDFVGSGAIGGDGGEYCGMLRAGFGFRSIRRGVLLRSLLVLASIAAHCGSCMGEEAVGVLTPEEMADSVISEEISIPTPGEFFSALSRAGRPNWSAAGRCEANLAATGRPQIALNVGALVADGYLAVENQNSQDVKNVGKDILAVARKLNASERVLARGNSINEFAENNEWNTLREELESTQNEIKLTLLDQKDEHLLALISAGSWLRSLQAGVLATGESIHPSSAALFRQPGATRALLLRIDTLPEKFRQEPIVESTRAALLELRSIFENLQSGSLSPDELARVHEITRASLEEICSRQQPPVNAEPSPKSDWSSR